MFRLFLIRILLSLLRVPVRKIDEKRIRMWFWTAYPQQGFQDYITKSDMSILQRTGIGVSRDEYLTLLGRRIEVGLLLSHAKKAYERVEKDRKEKIEAIKNTPTQKKIIKPTEEPKPKTNENTNNQIS